MDVFSQINDWFQKMSPEARRRIMTWGVLGAGLLGLGFWWAFQPRWAALYSGLDPKDAGAVVEKLKEAKVPYRLTRGGAEIQVPDEKVYEQRLALAAAGLPQGQGQGYELLDKGNTFGLSEEAARLNSLRALQGELERTIMTLSGVEGARVHLVVPERRLFSRERPSASASVVLKVRPGRGLSDEEASGIVHLVSHAVEGLAPENVALLDTQGRQLADMAGGGGTGLGGRVAASARLERYLREKAQTLMDEALGVGVAMVRINADLDLSSATITRETFTAPDGKGLIRQQDSQSSNSGSTPVGGAPGKPSTLSVSSESPINQTSAGSANNSSSTNSSTRYELNRTIENVTQGGGALRKLSVTLMLKRNVPAADLAPLKEAVANAVGLDPKRGDSLAVVSVPASLVAEVPKEDPTMATRSRNAELLSMAKAAAPWAAALVITMAAYAAFGKVSKAISQSASSGDAHSQNHSGYPANTFGVGGHGQGLTQQEILELARKNPASAAQVLRRWMN
jgi:flagellar M-ring protein FliF